MMELTPWRPFGEIGRLRRDMDALWRRFLGEAAVEPSVSEGVPSVDISETDDNFLVKAELPGLEAEDVDINVSEDLLTIRGEKKTKEEKQGENFYSRERCFGAVPLWCSIHLLRAGIFFQWQCNKKECYAVWDGSLSLSFQAA
jgi:HSP20 family protein